MKKLLFIFAAVTALTANADYLYWMVGTPNPSTGENYIGQTIDFTTWDNAKLIVDGSSIAAATMTKANADFYSSIDGYAVADIGTSYQSFMVELWCGQSYLGYASETADNLAQYIFADKGMSSNIATAGWAPTSFAVPEPTSGLLFLLGGMLLGLKRRRMA